MEKMKNLIRRVQRAQQDFLDIQKAANDLADEQPAEEAFDRFLRKTAG